MSDWEAQRSMETWQELTRLRAEVQRLEKERDEWAARWRAEKNATREAEQAAEEVPRLRAEVERLTEHVATWIDRYHEAKSRAEQAEREREEAVALAARREELAVEFKAESRRYARRNRALEAALRPFADEAGEWADDVPDDAVPMISGPDDDCPAKTVFTLGDLRRARALLSPAPGGERKPRAFRFCCDCANSGIANGMACSCGARPPTPTAPEGGERIVRDHFFMNNPHHPNQCRVHVPAHEAGGVVGTCCGYPREAHQPTLPAPNDCDCCYEDSTPTQKGGRDGR